MKKGKIRRYKSKDLFEVLEIEGLSFSDPWSKTMFDVLFEINPKGLYVIEKNSRILGYAIVLLEPHFAGSVPERRAHLINLAVHPDFRKKGIGSNLVGKITKDMKSEKVHSIYLEVRKSNKAALKFYSNLLFQRIGLIKRFYLDEDAIVMSKTISN
jgi:ribosomal-protein-alanine N-acetyltransferase